MPGEKRSLGNYEMGKHEQNPAHFSESIARSSPSATHLFSPRVEDLACLIYEASPADHRHSSSPLQQTHHRSVLSKKDVISTSCCDGTHHHPVFDAETASEDDKYTPHATETIIQIRPQSHHSTHITLSVPGMDCSSCEQSLINALNSFPEISNVRTAVLLSQADFDFTSSATLGLTNIEIAISRKIGRPCTINVQVDEETAELDLIIREDILSAVSEWPVGVTAITKSRGERIKVYFTPREIGARDLMASPCFRYAQLAPPSPSPLIAAEMAHARREFVMTLVSTVLTIPVLIISYSRFQDQRTLYGGVCLTLASLVQIVVGRSFYIRGFKSLMFSRRVEMDMLVVLSTTTAYVYSVIAYGFLVARKPLSTPEFFETSTLLMTLIMVGRTLSAWVRHKAVRSMSIESKQSSVAIIINTATNCGHVEEQRHTHNHLRHALQHKQDASSCHGGCNDRIIDVRLLQHGDIFKVYPDSTVATDGIVIKGTSELDESLITGESTLVVKRPGMAVLAGSVNHSGTLLVQLSNLPHNNTINTISSMVDDATSSKPKVQEMADQVARWFIPLVVVLTILVFITWIILGKTHNHQSTSSACIIAMTRAISVLIVSCPCAIGLAVPMVAIIAGGVGAKHGLIIKSGVSLETGRKITHVVFDKTGTLTEGKLTVEAEEYLAEDREEAYGIILGLVTGSRHPVSAGMASHLNSDDARITPLPLEEIERVTGNGIRAIYKGRSIRAGSATFLGVETHPTIYKLLQQGLSLFCVELDGKLMASFGLQDKLRSHTKEVILELRARKVTVSIISGDHETAVKLVAHQLDIPVTQTRSLCSPQKKKDYVDHLIAAGETVLFCGDGTNDSIAIAQANIGMHVNQDHGTDVAKLAADVILMRPSLNGILTLMDLSKAFHTRVVFNFAWSFVYNVLAVLLAAGVVKNAIIPPQYAGLGELVSVVPVIVVGVSLRLFKRSFAFRFFGWRRC